MYLNCHTAFSFKYGTLRIKDLFAEAKRCQVGKLVLTEINNTSSYIEMLRVCAEHATVPETGLTKYGKESHNLEIAVGVEFRQDNQLLYIAIAKNNNGFERINRFLSFHNRDGRRFPNRAPALEDVFIIYPFRTEPETLRINEFIGVRKSELTQLALYKPYQDYRDKFVVLHPVTFATKKGFNIHRLLRAIHHNTLLSKLAPEQQAQSDEIMEPEEALKQAFDEFPNLVWNAEKLISQCSLDFQLGKDKNKSTVTGSTADDLALLRQKAWDGFVQRYDANSQVLVERFEREMQVIQQKKFCGYYLITYDLIQFAQRKRFDYVGRGSGANSLIAYCLGITNVDPVALNLYFERFLNEERASPPDFDIDFSWDNRDAIYEYLFERYGQEHVCLLGTHVTFQRRSIIRELGKVFGLPKDEIDDLVEFPEKNKDRDHITKLVIEYAGYIIQKELPSNMSIHAGGVLITEKPIYAYTATELPQKGYHVSHFEMQGAEDMGIFKFDILSQRGLGHLKEAVRHISRNKGVAIDIHRYGEFMVDEKIKKIMRSGKTMGCFYVESPAMRMLLEKLHCEDYLTLIAASSIIRPGVASSGMMKTYIERFHLTQKGKTYDVIHPFIDELMKETYGVMVYQEDVIKVAHHFAGLTLTEADVLRRGMSGKYRSREEFQQVKERFFECCAQKHYPLHITERVWYEIESFSGFSFAKGHSASYAVESYQSLFLKAHYPLEFMVGVINNFGGFYKTEFYFHEARMNGAEIEAPCINSSDYLTTIYDEKIFMGFIHIKSLEGAVAKEISIERGRNGAFRSLDDFLSRVTMGLEQIRILIRIGALRFTGKSKQKLLWEAMLHYSQAKTKKTTTALFDTEPKDYPLPTLTRHAIEDAFDEIELLGFPLCDPFCLLETTDRGDTLAIELRKRIGQQVHIIGYLVTVKDTGTKSGDRMNFGTFYDSQGEIFDTIHFPQIAKRFPLRGRGFYSIKGIVIEDFGVAMIQVASMEKLHIINKRAEEFMQENIAESKFH
ncbi:DNA polymerase III subunit alpha [Pseudochryseolinea flava]|uniref:DNA-directed DNA polymerase n=1 Tax=Pseudochryseolinea flava TaxID=2059302 RepID=A0A364XYH0_9BACT|nr:DNA polymerase III subunit alpha [Pseudochryseolinea flava]RAV99549.1 DNA polymerase III subunit alpha [Pseudochryseolinea flava]